MKNLDYVPFLIGQQFVPAIVNDDRSGTTETEDKQLDSFMASLPLGGWFDFHIGHDGGRKEEEEFHRCEVTGLRGKCVHANYMLLPDDWENQS